MFLLFKIAKRLVTTIILLAIIIPLFVAYQIWNTGHNAQPLKSDAIVILGAAQYNGVPSTLLAVRIQDARLLYEQAMAPKIITVGTALKGDAYSEAQSSALRLENDLGSLGTKKVSHKDVVVLSAGRDTLSSTVAYAAYMKLHNMKSVIIATDPYHCFRAISMASDLGIKATCAPTKSGPGSLSATGIKYIFRETGAYLSYKTVGQIGIHLSDQIKK
jgi:vancomycin permeability regulator SanA